jgi:hypothetical protein
MIKSKNGVVKIDGEDAPTIMADLMVAMCSVSRNVIIPTFGKENLRVELHRIADEVCDSMEKEFREE